mmetsp:Transcript_14357/g.19992  ORF Transcript_14357/g.19992 Transcript_14357/m.19992 type:complete len:554 (+) Transcript_14357:227-1888(+)
MEGIPDDLVLEILSWVPPLDLLRSTALVSIRFATLLVDDDNKLGNTTKSWKHFWEHYNTRAITFQLSARQLQRCCIYAAAIRSASSSSQDDHDHDNDNRYVSSPHNYHPYRSRIINTSFGHHHHKTVIPSFLHDGSVLVSRDAAWNLASTGFRACVASTTEFASEQIENVLASTDSMNNYNIHTLVADNLGIPPYPTLWDDNLLPPTATNNDTTTTAANNENENEVQNNEVQEAIVMGDHQQEQGHPPLIQALMMDLQRNRNRFIYNNNNDLAHHLPQNIGAHYQENHAAAAVAAADLLISHHSNLSSGNSWWSSRPSTSNETPETLLFTTRYPLTLLSDVFIKPLLDPFDGKTCYTWNRLVIRAYLFQDTNELGEDTTPIGSSSSFSSKDGDSTTEDRSSPSSLSSTTLSSTAATARIVPGYPSRIVVHQEDEQTRNFRRRTTDLNPHEQRRAKCDQDVIDNLLQNQTPVYESQLYEIVNSNNVNFQRYSFPQPGIVANVVTITLKGKNSKQFDHTGYYACVDRVVIRGIPLYGKNNHKNHQNHYHNDRDAI